MSERLVFMVFSLFSLFSLLHLSNLRVQNVIGKYFVQRTNCVIRAVCVVKMINNLQNANVNPDGVANSCIMTFGHMNDCGQQNNYDR